MTIKFAIGHSLFVDSTCSQNISHKRNITKVTIVDTKQGKQVREREREGEGEREREREKE